MRFYVYAFLLPALMVVASMVQAQTVPRAAAIALQKGDYDQARAEMRDANAFDQRVLEAIIQQRQGQHAQAAETLRALLEERPDARALRRGLVTSLRALDQHRAALFHIDQLIETAPDAERRARDRATRRDILADRPFGARVSFALIPSSNINRATGTTSFEFDGIPLAVNETGVSGLGTQLTLSGFRRFELGEGHLQLDGSVSATAFDDDRFNRASLSVALSYMRPLDDGFLRTRAFVTRNLFAESANNNAALGLGVQRRWLTSPRQYWDLHVNTRSTRYDDAGKARLDNHGLELGVATGRRISPRTTLTAGLTLIANRAKDDRFSHNGARLQLGVAHGFRNGLRLDVSGFGERLSFDETFAPFPVARRDSGAGIKIAVQHNRVSVFGAVPRLECSLTRRTSNIVFYDNRNVTECNVGLSHRF